MIGIVKLLAVGAASTMMFAPTSGIAVSTNEENADPGCSFCSRCSPTELFLDETYFPGGLEVGGSFAQDCYHAQADCDELPECGPSEDSDLQLALSLYDEGDFDGLRNLMDRSDGEIEIVLDRKVLIVWNEGCTVHPVYGLREVSPEAMATLTD